MPLAIDVTVAAIATRGEEFLIVEETIRQRLVLGQPAGHLEAGESLVEAVRRETFEETGYRFNPRYIVGSYLWPNPRKDLTCLRIFFAGDATPAKHPVQLDPVVNSVCWLTRGELAREEARLRSSVVLAAIDDFLAGKRIALDAFTLLDARERYPGAVAAS